MALCGKTTKAEDAQFVTIKPSALRKLKELISQLEDENILLKSALAAIVDIVSHAQREKSIQDHIANAIRTMSDPLNAGSEKS